jgi:hypothetical protein
VVIKPKGAPNDPGPKPKKNKQGTYDCMLESMKRKQVTEPQTARRFIRWGEPVKETFQRYVYWSIELEYEASIVFGKAEVLVHALVRGGIVHIWMYRGSGEIVP